MEKIRCGKTVYTRKDEYEDWTDAVFLQWLKNLGHAHSINSAKKFNGLDSRTVASFKMLPAKRVVQEVQQREEQVQP